MEETDPEDAADTRNAIYIELPLGVEARFDPDEPPEGYKDLYLAKVNPADGQVVDDSLLHTGYVLEVATDTIGPLSAEDEPLLTPEQAAAIHEQYKIQEEAGLRIAEAESES
jgi:hypothetical protein